MGKASSKSHLSRIATGRGNAVQCSINEKTSGNPSDTEQALSLSELLASTAELFLFSYAPSLRSLITWSDNSELVLGLADSKIVRDGNLFLRHVHVDDRFQLMNDLESALDGTKDFRATYRWIRPDRNELRWLRCRAKLSESNQMQVLEGVIFDISDELIGPLRYFSVPETLHNVLSTLPGLVVILDNELRITRLSHSIENKNFGFGDFAFKHSNFRVGQKFLSCFSDQQTVAQIQQIANSIYAAASNSASFRAQEDNRSYEVDFFSQSSPGESYAAGLLCIVSDISELVQLESRVADLQRAESLRLLSAGIGHHFNNALQTIIGQASIINSHSEDLNLVKSASESIISNSLKAAELTRQLFSTTEKSEPKPLDINLVLTEAANGIDDLFGSGFKISVVLGQPPLVRASHDSLMMVFEAILKNARDAMITKDAYKHRLSIRTYSRQLGDKELENLTAGTYAQLVVTDTGSGMDPNTLAHCFDPFFTTKEPDILSGVNINGKGLGLSKAFSIVRALGGTIKIESHQPIGTCVEVYLPADELNSQAYSQQTTAIRKNLELIPHKDSPRLLLVDDDQIVSFAVQAMIHQLEEHCVLAHNYSSALNLMKRYESSLELIFLDILMPSTDSSMVLRRLKRIKPSCVIIGFSGTPPEQWQPLLEAGALEVIQKPVEMATLKEVIDRYLSKRQNTAIS